MRAPGPSPGRALLSLSRTPPGRAMPAGVPGRAAGDTVGRTPTAAPGIDTTEEHAMTITAHDHHATLRHEERDALGTALQSVLVDLTDLALAGKQLHWNIVGPRFRSLHLQLDDLVDSGRNLGDQVAERARALGWAPDGRRETIAADSTLPGVPEGELPDHDVVDHATALLVQAISSARAAMERAAEYDPVTEDLLHQVVHALEEHAWMFSAQAIGR
jgi:starvation-inducible DNA-binding protein